MKIELMNNEHIIFDNQGRSRYSNKTTEEQKCFGREKTISPTTHELITTKSGKKLKRPSDTVKEYQKMMEKEFGLVK